MSEETLPATLTAKERKEFAECNRIITDGLPSVWSVGAALSRVRDARLYREDFASFQEYSESKWQLSLPHAKRLMDAAEVKVELEERAPTLAKLVVNEAQARELGKYPEEERTSVLRHIKKSGEPITAEAIRAFRETAKSGNGKKETPANIDSNVAPIGAICKKEGVGHGEVQLDEAGNKIPVECLPYWHRRQEVQDILTSISRARGALEKVLGEKRDPLYWNVLNTVVSDLGSAYAGVTNAKPYAVCCVCRGGVKRTSCQYCGGIGLMSKFNYERQLKAEAGR